MQSEPQPPAPAVVAVVVTCDPGPWFEQVLASFAAQDYPNLSVLVIDSGSFVDPTHMIAEALPGAFIRRLENRVGFGRAANEVLELVEGASHFVLCHDDVVPAPDAIRYLVEEAFRSNAGIATPKFVQWDEPDKLLAVGATADKVGVMQDVVEPGELDQQQHDVVREVLVAPAGLTLIRADLFAALGGFDPAIDQFGEDLDLSWRARVAGARVTTVPDARVRHLQALNRGERAGWGSAGARRRAARLTESHRVRTMLKCYRWFDLLWIVPLALLWVLGEVATRLIQGRFGDAWHTLSSFWGGWRRPRDLWRVRRQVQQHRGAGDGEIRRLQLRGNAKFRTFVRSRVDGVRQTIPIAALPGRLGRTAFDDFDESGQYEPLPDRREGPGRRRGSNRGVEPGTEEGLADGTETGDGGAAEAAGEPAARRFDWRITALVGLTLLVALIFGTRSLFGHELSAVGILPNTSGGLGHLWSGWWSTWQQNGLGVTAPTSPAVGLLAVLGTVLFGAVGTLQHVVVLAPLIVGPIGAYRAARWWGSGRGRFAALVAFAVNPLPYNALARGQWGGLLAWAAAPWILSWFGRLSGEIPFPTTRFSQVRGRVLGLGIVAAVVASVAPSFLVVVGVVGVALFLGGVLAGRPLHSARMLGVAVAAAVIGVILLLPWSGDVLGNRVALLGPSLGSSARLGFGQVLRFNTGPFGGGILSWALLIVAALPLVIGREWRLAWATRLWVVALSLFALTWAGSRGWIPALPPDVALAPAGAALAAAAALGAAAFELDLPGYRFGWRQLALAVAGVALALATVPFLAASGGGRWDLPSADASSVLAFLPGSHGGDYRVLWVGSPQVLPLAGNQLSAGVAYATSFDGEPGPSDLWASSQQGETGQLATDLRLVESGLTTKLGHLLAPAAVRYIVIPNHDGPSGSGSVAEPAPSALLAGLGLQTDLQVVDVGDTNYVVYQNAAWAPARSVLSPATAGAVAGADAAAAGGGSSIQGPLQDLDLTSSQPVLTGGGSTSVRGSVPAPSTVYVAMTPSSSWRLHVGSANVKPTPALGWGMTFQVPPGAGSSELASSYPARLSYQTSLWARAEQVFEVLAWVAAVAVFLLDLRRRRGMTVVTELVDQAWFLPRPGASALPAHRDRGRRGRPGSTEARGQRRRLSRGGARGAESASGAPDSDEMWIDV